MGLLKLSIIGAKYALERKQFYYPSETKKNEENKNLDIIEKIVNEQETRIIDYQLVHQRVVTLGRCSALFWN